MKVRLSYGQILVGDGAVTAVGYPLTAPVDDLLGLLRRGGTDAAYREYLVERYGPDAVVHLDVARGRTDARAIERAARTIATGQLDLSTRLASHLAKVRFHFDERSAEVPNDNVLALAMWAIVMIVIREQVRVIKCPNCNAPWLAQPHGSEHCLRPAPGHSRSCRELQKERDLHARTDYATYRREYKRLSEAVRRGSLNPQVVEEWRAANSVESWKPFDQWKTERNADIKKGTKKRR